MALSLSDALALAIFSGLIGFMFGFYVSTPFTRFVMRRLKVLDQENRSLKAAIGKRLPDQEDNHEDADWWKKR